MEENQNKSPERVRKTRSKAGERSQQSFTFRLDNENSEWLRSQANRGRYINELIAADRERQRIDS